ncbi:MAG: hypothetical protein ACYCO5_02005 [Acidobacteriaceae bacterium]
MVLAVLALGAVTGCGSKFNGTLCESCGNGPTPPAGGAVVTSVSPASVAAGGPAFTLTVTGKNFAPSMTVGGIATTSTTYVSSTEMQAQVPASAIANPGSLTIVAVTSPPSTLSFGVGFTITDAAAPGSSGFTVSNVAIEANDMVWDPTSQQMFLSVLGSNGTNGNTITALNPANAQLGISQAAGGTPDKLAISSDGSYLYAGIDSLGTVQRFILPNLGTDISIPLGSAPMLGLYDAMQIASEPGEPHSVAILRGSQSNPSLGDSGGVVIYDDAQARPTSTLGSGSQLIGSTNLLLGSIGAIRWKADGSTIYARGPVNSGEYLYILSVTSGGVQATNGYSSDFGIYGSGLHYLATTGYLYSNGGQAVDPNTGITVGRFPLNAVGGGLTYGIDVMVPDGSLGIAYFLGQTQSESGTSEYTLEAFDLTQFTLLGSIAIPNVVGAPVKLIRWGTNGLAFLTQTRNTNDGSTAPGAGDGVYVISGAFVTNPAAQGRKFLPSTH